SPDRRQTCEPSRPDVHSIPAANGRWTSAGTTCRSSSRLVTLDTTSLAGCTGETQKFPPSWRDPSRSLWRSAHGEHDNPGPGGSRPDQALLGQEGSGAAGAESPGQ